MTKKVCISGYYGFDNFGDETILKVLVENLKEYDITVFSSNPDKTSSNLNVKSVQSFNIREIIKSLYKTDCLISGGGSLLQDVTSAKSLIYYLGVITLAQLFGKNTIIFAQGIGPIRNKLLDKITTIVLKNIKYITVRDDNSLNWLKNRKINAIKCADAVWNIEQTDEAKTNKIGIQLRNFSTLNEEFLSQLATYINEYYKDNEVFIYSLQNKLDLDICNKLKSKLNNAKVIENNSNEEITRELAKLNTLIGMRFHACLIGIKNNVKVLPINYDIKVETLANEFDLKCLNLTNISNNKKIFEEFVNKEIRYDKNKIESLKFNFEELKSKI